MQPNASAQEMLLRVFKEEKVLEVWIKKQSDSVFHLAGSFPARNDMPLGPKQNDRDGKVPEGFYYINKLNSAGLSLTINFPNVADKIIQHNQHLKGKAGITSGENSMTSDILLSKENLQDLSVYFVEAKNNGCEYVPIHIFPFKMSAANLQKKLSAYKNDKGLCDFWTMIEPGYTFFEKFHKPPVYSYSRTGYWFRAK
jgi:murein L,D-transpeptidase YafK